MTIKIWSRFSPAKQKVKLLVCFSDRGVQPLVNDIEEPMHHTAYARSLVHLFGVMRQRIFQGTVPVGNCRSNVTKAVWQQRVRRSCS